MGNLSKNIGKKVTFFILFLLYHQAWQNAIKEDSTFSFQHVIGTFPNGKKTKLLSRLNIKAIPANFLIDKDQRIVAKNLRGERLAQVLDSLIQK